MSIRRWIAVVVTAGLLAAPAGTAAEAPSADKSDGLCLTSISGVGVRPAAPMSAREECGLKPKDVFKECPDCPELVVVPAGSFVMGSAADEDGRQPEEGPQHPVTFARPFASGRFAVTFAEWDACVADGGCEPAEADAGWGRGRRPVIDVSWHDAHAYVVWLARKTGKPYRLLNEAEREYVTRAGTTTPFWWGTSISPAQATTGEG